MGVVAFITGGLPYRFMGIGFLEPPFFLGVTGIAYRVHPGPQHPGEVRTVRVMARAAPVLGEGGVDIFGFLDARERRRMAGGAELAVLGREESLVLRGMGGVAGQAPAPARDRGMLERRRGLLARVATEAEFVACLHEQSRLL